LPAHCVIAAVADLRTTGQGDHNDQYEDYNEERAENHAGSGFNLRGRGASNQVGCVGGFVCATEVV
jgi:hypothetical protein